MNRQVLIRQHHSSADALAVVRPAAAALPGDDARSGPARFISAARTFDRYKPHRVSALLPFNNVTPDLLGDLSRQPASTSRCAQQASPAQTTSRVSRVIRALDEARRLATGTSAIVDRNQRRVLISSIHGRTRAA
ncbi:MAG: hypothetical protein RML73_06935 [Anaerolineae bacterium]|nr:hypothetical protein [Anaerolineae bacterium]